jgi:D-alanyl-D-alanine carboxypeptidase
MKIIFSKTAFSIIIFLIIVLLSAAIVVQEDVEKGLTTKQTSSLSEVDQLVNKFMDKSQYVGLAIGAQQDGKSVFSKAYGFSDRETGQRFLVDENMALGSNAKTLTAASILLLAQRGVLKLTDRLSDHLPFTIKQDDVMSLHDLLCHVSGMPDVFGGKGYEDYIWQNAQSQKEFIDKVNENTEPQRPGIKYQYNNTGYFLLGMVIEHVTNQPLGDFYREQFFSPLQLEKAYYLGDSFYSPKLAKMYETDNDVVQVYQGPVEYRIPAAAGSLGGDLDTYMKLFTQILTGKILSEPSKKQMKTACTLSDGTKVVNNKKQNIGLGIEISEINSQRLFSRGGAMNGHVSAIYHVEETGLTLAIVGNTFMRLAHLLDVIIEQKLLIVTDAH